jgi:hypothetical protein
VQRLKEIVAIQAQQISEYKLRMGEPQSSSIAMNLLRGGKKRALGDPALRMPIFAAAAADVHHELEAPVYLQEYIKTWEDAVEPGSLLRDTRTTCEQIISTMQQSPSDPDPTKARQSLSM